MRSVKFVTFVIVLVLFAACSTYKSKPQLTYYHGPNIPESYFTIVRASATEIEFQIRVEWPDKKMYHLILDGNTPVAEGWFSTIRLGGAFYNVTMKPGDGQTFEVGKTYRLCIGRQAPQAVQMSSSNYECAADYVFVFQEKS